jgi:hypothetical protein
MKPSTTRRLEELRSDFAEVTGRPFTHFHCPVLFRDEPAELCEAHVINGAFPRTSRRVTVQRKDVDDFFGSKFEADFVLLAERGKHDLRDVLADPSVARRLRPQLFADGQAVAYYRPHDEIPSAHTPIVVERPGAEPVRLALKVEPSQALALVDAKWEIVFQKDVRLGSLVSLLKAAHLTLFELMGYRYALSAGGRFLGWDVLGKFLTDSRNLSREEVLAAGVRHFTEFVNLVRPMVYPPEGLSGTISDGQIYLCTGTPLAWAIMVFVKVDDQMHAVLVPVLEDAESAGRFVRFLKEPESVRFEIRLGEFAGDRWNVAKTTRVIDWPTAGLWDSPGGVV